MRRTLVRGLVTLVFTAVAGSACDKSTESGPTTPTSGPVETAEPDFTGTLSINGAVIYPFTANVGLISAIVKSIEPNTPEISKSIGVDAGVWSGVQCGTLVSNNNAGVGSGVAASANAVSNFCIRVYDAGNDHALTEPVTFVVHITHF